MPDDVPEPAWAVLLDLDDTLIWTAQLERLRAARNWAAVYQNFSQTTLPPGTAQFVAQVRLLARIGVVTMAQRSYAERLLVHHGLRALPVLVAYHDVQHRKPDPEPILMAAQKLACTPSRCIYIGDRPDDMLAARRAGAVPIGMVWPHQRASTQLGSEERICCDWTQVLAVITESMEAGRRLQNTEGSDAIPAR